MREADVAAKSERAGMVLLVMLFRVFPVSLFVYGWVAGITTGLFKTDKLGRQTRRLELHFRNGSYFIATEVVNFSKVLW
jgi:hypothetical protein